MQQVVGTCLKNLLMFNNIICERAETAGVAEKLFSSLSLRKPREIFIVKKLPRQQKCVLHFDIDKDICFHSRLQHDVRTTWPHFKWDSSGIGSNVNAMLDCSVYSAEAIRALCLYG